ncbi:katanin p60 ATPase-containing subunit A-like 2 isoform X2 [Bombus huntii]|uniref:katanin p60 ATPase-containing subunit A-like 2 isoform X2 n=1 Tax=Bombus huntii TaxID=85661 RepID=UPI0021AABFF4|nr:katanin p60 ATPase-containing subunit A-like 2 isoform X2 [Bombus huntii]XP_050495291.1 katanin p60 ATPase-containing subunit A-like 2 isoform X2 [Bombus huntii]XP_050496037.1 katanin p60 ATPase-containing subunit A-like 2 isoform X2 [Bombus huntii]XP_050496043.1 katanin p60 ATPase-containing subunit A-like 2 isoform X2 [Bombus huntii]XP_050496048.1 katanin p60 ATPase-containing subunit A-like 2 isoform X2 [Bombus huntii]XP_050496118.1 katanin p60 ATPase-containing subunit A-like 2 isoform 
MNGDLSMQGSMNKIFYNLRKKEESRISERHRNILYLVCDYLEHNGNQWTSWKEKAKPNLKIRHRYIDISDVLFREARLSPEHRVCDNIDLEIIVAEYENYYKMKFQKYPILCKKITGREMTREVTNASKTSIETKAKSFSKQARSEPVKETNLQQKITDDNTNHINLAMTVTSIFPNESDGRSSEELFNVPMEQSMQSKILKCIEKLYSDNTELRKIAEDVSCEIVVNKLNVHWDDVIGLEECKTAVKEAVVYPLKYPISFDGPFSPWKGILLYGPPGTGKTKLAKAVATECHCTFFNITAS